MNQMVARLLEKCITLWNIPRSVISSSMIAQAASMLRSIRLSTALLEHGAADGRVSLDLPPAIGFLVVRTGHRQVAQVEISADETQQFVATPDDLQGRDRRPVRIQAQVRVGQQETPGRNRFTHVWTPGTIATEMPRQQAAAADVVADLYTPRIQYVEKRTIGYRRKAAAQHDVEFLALTPIAGATRRQYTQWRLEFLRQRHPLAMDRVFPCLGHGAKCIRGRCAWI